jgi:hypothetical protein
MALTRPKIWDLDTDVEYFKDPITVLHQGATSANVDVGFLFNRANGLVSNVAVYWSESAQSIVTAFTSNTGATNSNIALTSYANITVGNVLLINGTIAINGNVGQAGQYITSTGSGMAWTSVTNTYTNANVADYLSTYTGTLSYGTASVAESSSTTASIGTTPTAIDTFATATYRGAKYLISTTDVTNSQYQMAEAILTQDGTNVVVSVYGITYTGTSTRMTFSASISSGTVTLYATGASLNNTVKLARTLIPV